MTYYKFKINKLGFSLVELMVSISIVTVIMSVVLLAHNSFVDRASLSSSSQDVTISIREAQVYGLNTRETAIGSGQFGYAYGVYFNPTYNPSSYFIFSDSNSNDLYDVGNGCGSGTTECLEEVILKDGVTVGNVCTVVGVDDSCSNLDAAHFTFKRPVTDAVIYFTDKRGNNKTSIQKIGKIQLKSKDGKITYVNVDSVGQVTTQN